MVKIIYLPLLLLIMIMPGCGLNSRNHQKPEDVTMVYRAGYRSISFVDSSRTYKPNVGQSDPLYFRPVDIDIWYPARPVASDTTLRFGHFLQLLQDRANY